ncbi:hypothetical protein S7711_10477 [Stachybotrys chartarum IBT 7711]|uniref:Uncharacterized protein n=1 Tax=Stachybotrys chartarum (strain CBS 109288 / IBT 7711) TaxID=1280523 RepID=A0A084BC24_STACB|nr:hypothetical protein S7711_10477 [Stachybotrys chartarum IBT 7711]
MSVIRDSISRLREIAAATGEAKGGAWQGGWEGGGGLPAGPETWACPRWDKARQRSLLSKDPPRVVTAAKVLAGTASSGRTQSAQAPNNAPSLHSRATPIHPTTQPRASPLRPQASLYLAKHTLTRQRTTACCQCSCAPPFRIIPAGGQELKATLRRRLSHGPFQPAVEACHPAESRAAAQQENNAEGAAAAVGGGECLSIAAGRRYEHERKADHASHRS